MNRIIWIDNAKCFAIFLVVLGHCTFFFGENLFMLEIKKQLFSPNMHLFAFLSGLISYSKYRSINDLEDLKNHIRPLIHKIVIPNIALSSVLSICSHYTNRYEEQYSIYINFFLLLCLVSIITIHNNEKYLTKFKSIINFLLLAFAILNICGKLGNFWYLTYYFISSVVFSSVLAIGQSKAKLKFQTCIFISVVVLFLIDGFVPFGASSELTISFVLGLYASNLMLFTNMIKVKYILLLCGVLLLILPLQEKIGYISFYELRFSKMLSFQLFPIFILRQLYAICFILLTCMIFAKLSRHISMVSEYGRITMGIYTIHSFIILQTRGLYIYENNNWYVWFFVILSSVFLFMITVWIVKLLENNKLLSSLFLGYKI